MLEATNYTDMASFSMEFIVYRHHVYKVIWSSVLAEKLQCRHHEVGNISFQTRNWYSHGHVGFLAV